MKVRNSASGRGRRTWLPVRYRRNHRLRTSIAKASLRNPLQADPRPQRSLVLQVGSGASAQSSRQGAPRLELMSAHRGRVLHP